MLLLNAEKNNQNNVDKKSTEDHGIRNIKIYLRIVYKITSIITSQKINKYENKKQIYIQLQNLIYLYIK